MINIKIRITFVKKKPLFQDLVMTELGSQYRIQLDSDKEAGHFPLSPF